ncbi:MAG: ABC transporter permease [Muribaculaceae bacterium]|nr:ABC transporter permease [Muribaculaceae bacterium]
MVSLRIALRYLFAKKSHNAVNVISIVSTVGVAVATASIVCVLSVFNGFTALSMERLSVVSPDVMVTPVRGKVIADADAMAASLGEVEGVAVAYPVIDDQALAMYHNRQIPVRVIGVPAESDTSLMLEPPLIDGSYMVRDSLNEGIGYAALSVGVAMQLGARPGYFDWLALYAPKRVGRFNPANPMGAFMTDSLCVSAVYEVEDNEFDANTLMVPMDVARGLFDYASEASCVYVGLAPGTRADEAVRRIEAAVGSGYAVRDRLRQQESSFRMIEIEKWITFAMLAFILAIASFNVVSTLSMLIIEKSADIFTLRALGASARMIRRVFLLEGWLISLVGGACGLVAGVALVLAQQWGGFIKLGGDPSRMSISVYPVQLQVWDIVAVGVLVALTGYVFGAVTSRLMTASGSAKG